MARKIKILIVGKKNMKDYTGSKSIYVFNALNEAGIPTYLYDMDANVDPPPGCTHLIFLPWINSITPGWKNFIERLGLSHRILYTDNWHWYEECRNKFSLSDQFDLDGLFSTIAFSTSENIAWWPKAKFEMWGGLVDEDLARPKEPKNYIYIDEFWPSEWSTNQFNASDLLDVAIPLIKEKTNLQVVTQKRTVESANPSWADEVVEPHVELPVMLDYLAKSNVYLTTHEESLGWMQLEAQVCGVPVVTNEVFSKNEVFETGDGCTFKWSWFTKPTLPDEPVEFDHENFDHAIASLMDAIDRALRADRKHIRESAIERYGKAAWVQRTQLLMT